MASERYNELTNTLIAAGRYIADRAEAEPTAANVALAVDMLRKQSVMLDKLYETTTQLGHLIDETDCKDPTCIVHGSKATVSVKDLIGKVRGDSVEAMRAAFNGELERRAGPDPKDVLGADPTDREQFVQMPVWSGEKLEQLADLFAVIHAETNDEDPRDIILRAMAVYRSFVTHARAGGQVKFVKTGSPDRTLKVRLR